MRKPLAISSAAARLSAERPERNATGRSGCGERCARGVSGRGRGGLPSGIVRPFVLGGVLRSFLGDRQRALVDLAARLAGDCRDLSNRLLDAESSERVV